MVILHDRRRPADEPGLDLLRCFRARFGAISCGELVRDHTTSSCVERKLRCARIVAFVTDAVARELGEHRRDRTGSGATVERRLALAALPPYRLTHRQNNQPLVSSS